MKSILCIVLAVLTLCLTSLLIAPALPEGYTHAIRAKLEHLQQAGDQYNLIFVGSSRIFHDVKPGVFDATSAELGQPLKSFNFGFDGVRHNEGTFFVDKVLAMDLPNLKTLVVEAHEAGPRDIRRANRFTRRMINWHDPERTQQMMVESMDGEEPLKRRLKFAARHLRHGLHRFFNMGRGQIALDDWLRNNHKKPLPQRWIDLGLGKDGDGYSSLDAYGSKANQERFQTGADAYRERVSKLVPWDRWKLNVLDKPPSPADERMLVHWQKMHERCEAKGIKLVLVVMPIASPYPTVRGPLDRQSEIPFLAFNEPHNYPQFFDPAILFDQAHFNDAGATLFSEELARQMRPYLAGEE